MRDVFETNRFDLTMQHGLGKSGTNILNVCKMGGPQGVYK